MKTLRFLALPYAALLAAPALFAQSSLLPKQFGPWQLTHCAVTSLQPALAKEAGERDHTVCQFSANGKTVKASAASYADPSSAYEVYTSLIQPGMQPSLLGKYSAVDSNQLISLAGNIVLRIQPHQDIAIGDLQSLLGSVQARGDKAPLPPVRQYLPANELVQGTQRYALGPDGFRAALDSLGQSDFGPLAREAGFQVGAEAMMAQYRNGKDSGVLLMLLYPTPQLAGLHWKHIEAVLPASAKGPEFQIERKGSLLSMVLKPSSAAYADKLRAGIGYETAVTINEPSTTLTDPPWIIVLKNIFTGTIVFCVLALAFGVAFGGVRVIIKRLWPGKVFDRPDRLEVLQLGLSGKRIDPSDFY